MPVSFSSSNAAALGKSPFNFFSACRTVEVSIVFMLLLVCSTRIDVDKQTHTHRPSTVTLAYGRE